jgi:hypothetical protein
LDFATLIKRLHHCWPVVLTRLWTKWRRDNQLINYVIISPGRMPCRLRAGTKLIFVRWVSEVGSREGCRLLRFFFFMFSRLLNMLRLLMRLAGMHLVAPCVSYLAFSYLHPWMVYKMGTASQPSHRGSPPPSDHPCRACTGLIARY